MKVVMAFGLACLGAVVVRAQIPTPPPNDAAKVNVVLLRVVNTVEASLAHESGSYKQLPVVLDAPMLKEHFVDVSQHDSVTAIVGEHRLILVVSEDLKHYQAMVSTGDSCAVTMFTNENGLIFSGRGLGCDRPN